MNKRCIATMMILTFMVLAMLACGSVTTPRPGIPFAYPTFTPSPLSGYNQETANAAAQATLAAGQREMTELSYQATVVNQNMDQAANAAAQTTLDYNQRQLMELSIRATEVSQNMAQAAATQQFITEQTQMAWNATATAQSQAVTAVFSTYILNVTQTAQAQVMLDVQATHTDQTNATLAAYSLTATPWAAIQAGIVRSRNESNRRAWWGEFVVTPLKLILFSLVIILLIVGGVLAYQRLMPMLELHLRTIWADNNNPLLLVSRKILDPDSSHRRFTRWALRQPNLPQVPSYETPQVEIIDPSDPPVALWIEETEQKLRTDGRIQL
jgi:hypothetical protein